MLQHACQHSSSLRALPAIIAGAEASARRERASRCVAGGREDVVPYVGASDGLFKEFSAPALRPSSNGGRSDAPIANQLCAVAPIPLPGLRRRSARARTRGQADRRATIFSLLVVETTLDELCEAFDERDE